MAATDLSALAGRLWDARTRSAACEPPTELHPELSIEDAYAVSRLNYERRLRSSKRLGRKIGLTSAAVQKQLGVDEPDFGYLTSDMAVPHGGELHSGALLQGKVEGETAFILARPLKGPGVTAAAARAATDSVVACIEIIDSRVRDWKIKIQDTIADNASSAFFALAPERRGLAGLDLTRSAMTLKINGAVRSTGMGAACLGDPAEAVAWLANRLGALGDGLEAGDIVLSGAFGPVVPFAPGDRCEAEIEGLGLVSCSYGR
ncbi:MAG: fumarylacetoacetate hydrolase family protein [Elusimicrobia bacterium]|nr:fumarylacetoacetate hydrolase family protein [Elusimicrobiota bacterium]